MTRTAEAPSSERYELLRTLRDAACEALGRHPEVAAAWVFGSTARGEAGPNSDVDIGILFEQRGETGAQHHRLLGDVASRLEQALERPIDLVVLETQGPMFRHRVLREGECIYERDRRRRIDFESTTYVEYFDFRPTWEIADRHALAGARRWLEERKR
jgi:uncharacterized protein